MSEQSDIGPDKLGEGRVELSEAQRRVISCARDQSVAVLGAPGTGKTTVLVELVAAEVEAGTPPEQMLAIAANRRLAAQLRDRLATRLQVAVRGGGLGRTVASVAHELVSRSRTSVGESAPRLLTGSQQDAILRDVIETATDPHGSLVRHRGELPWPDYFSTETPHLAGFRAELRELLAAMATHDVSPQRLAELSLPETTAVATGARHRALWNAVSILARDYEDVLVSAYESSYDTASMIALAARLIEFDTPTVGAPSISLVVVDDAQELTESGRRLLAAYERSGARVVTFGDPDVATGAFHGGKPELARGWRAAGEQSPPLVILDTRYRHGKELSEVFAQFASQIGVGGGAWEHRRAESGAATPPSGESRVPAAAIAEASNAHEESLFVAGYLRRLHLLERVPWSQLAVIARSRSALPIIERALMRAGIPTTTSAPVRANDDSTVRAILTLGLLAQSASTEWQFGDLQRALSSPLFGLDPLKLRAIRRALVRSDIAAREAESQGCESETRGAHSLRTGNDLLIETIAAEVAGERHPIGSAALDQLLARPQAEALRATGVRELVGVLQRMRQRIAAGDPIDTVLYEAWDMPARNERWQRIALGDGAEAAAMNRRLDSVVALFDRAKRFVERNPDASLQAFLAEWHGGAVVDDSLGAVAQAEAVTLTTPAGAVGQSWRGVAVVGVNEGVWPNLRVRDTLLGAGRLEEALHSTPTSSIIDRRRQVLGDESRMLLAAMSRTHDYLLLTAVNNDDTQPSPYLRQLQFEPLDSKLAVGENFELEHRLLSLDAVTGYLRRQLATDGESDARCALARLAREGIPGAHPDEWFAARGRSTEAPLLEVHEGSTAVPLLPSSLKGFTECPLNWFVERHAGTRPSTHLTVGNIVHEALERELEFADVVEFQQWVYERLQLVDYGAEWANEVQRGVAEDKALRLWEYLQSEHSGRGIGYETKLRFSFTEAIEMASGPLDVEVTVSGMIDRIETDERGVRIIDFKTGKAPSGVKKADYLPQLTAYQLAYAHGALAEPLQRVHTLEGESAQFDRALLVFPNTNKTGQPFTLVDQPALSADLLTEARQEFAVAALQQHGAVALESDAGSTTTSADALTIGDAPQPPRFLARVDDHCNSSWGSTPACSIHITPEVTA